MALESIEKLRELACDINGNEIVDHMQLYPSCVFDGAWLNSWRCEFDRELEALEREIAERYMKVPVDADGVPWTKSDRVFIVKNEQSPRNITAFSFELAEKRWLIEDDNCSTFYADECTHVKPDPVKELLRQYRNELEELIQGGFGNVDSLTDDFAERIREAVER